MMQVAFETGLATSYALFSCQERGQLCLGPGVEVYKGQIIGVHQRPGDLALNACKRKAATNVRSNKEATGNISSELSDCPRLECVRTMYFAPDNFSVSSHLRVFLSYCSRPGFAIGI